MPLASVNLLSHPASLPGTVRSFLHEAQRRIDRFKRAHDVPGFVPSEFEHVYGTLHTLAEAAVAPGDRFCEWGSGLGVVACLAAMIGFDACGIEIEGELVEAAQRLADDFALPVEFVRGSFIPPGGEVCFGAPADYGWLTLRGEDLRLEMGFSPEDFDVFFAYPWPDEERAGGELFERFASVGAVLVTYHGGGESCLRRKAA